MQVFAGVSYEKIAASIDICLSAGAEAEQILHRLEGRLDIDTETEESPAKG